MEIKITKNINLCFNDTKIELTYEQARHLIEELGKAIQEKSTDVITKSNYFPPTVQFFDTKHLFDCTGIVAI